MSATSEGKMLSKCFFQDPAYKKRNMRVYVSDIHFYVCTRAYVGMRRYTRKASTMRIYEQMDRCMHIHAVTQTQAYTWAHP